MKPVSVPAKLGRRGGSTPQCIHRRAPNSQQGRWILGGCVGECIKRFGNDFQNVGLVSKFQKLPNLDRSKKTNSKKSKRGGSQKGRVIWGAGGPRSKIAATYTEPTRYIYQKNKPKPEILRAGFRPPPPIGPPQSPPILTTAHLGTHRRPPQVHLPK